MINFASTCDGDIAKTQAILLGTLLNTYRFGTCIVVKRYQHDDTKELVWEVKADSGQRFPLTTAYINKLLGNP